MVLEKISIFAVGQFFLKNDKDLHDMNIRLLIAFIFAIAFTTQHAAAQKELPEETESQLVELDRAIADKDQFADQKEKQIQSMKNRAARLRGAERVKAYEAIYQQYIHTQADSAWSCMEAIRKANPKPNRDLQNLIYIMRAEISAVLGQAPEAMDYISKIDIRKSPLQLKLKYYHLCRTFYGWMENYAIDPTPKARAQKLTQAYRDSILQLEPEGLGRSIVVADQLNVDGKARQSLAISLADLKHAEGAERRYTLFNAAHSCLLLHDTTQAITYLAQAARADIEAGVREYQALPILAQIMYEQGQVERAYQYLICSMEDATSCNARLRTLETSKIFPIIDRAYKEGEKEQAWQRRLFTFTVAAFSLLLAAIAMYLYKQTKKLRTIRHALTAANEDLTLLNRNLHISDKMKEVYIARYLNRCRDYLDKLGNYRREIYKMVKARQTEELNKFLKSEKYISQERADFYADFDRAFLNLFPDFIDKFNELMQPGCQVRPKEGELLNTELRIFALIRLGVTDSNRIAHFLNYSLTTIYTYRSKLRNNATGDKAKFELQVMDIN